MASSPINESSPTEALAESSKSLLALLLPILALSFTGCLLSFFERLWSSQCSLGAIEASMSAIYVVRIFQLPCIALSMMGQVFVGRYNGAREFSAIGRCVWQLIWFSLLSMLVTVPLSLAAMKIFFSGTSIEGEVLPFFLILTFCNFLFPLGTALSSFYLGRQKLKLVFLLTVATQLLNAGLDLGLIFGINPWILPLGLKGAALGTVISQGLFCLVLFIFFLTPPNRSIYGTSRWLLELKTFWRYLTPAAPRAFGRIALLTSWAASSYVMTAKGGEHLLVLSIGGTVSLFLAFIGEGVLQAMVVLVSNAMGAKDDLGIKRYVRNGCLFLIIVSGMLAVPLACFPDSVLSLFSLGEGVNQPIIERLRETLLGVWVHTVIYILNSILLSVLLSAKDTLFLLALNLCNWVTSFLPVYLGINYFNVSPSKFWLILSGGSALLSCIYSWRIFRVGHSYKKNLSPTRQ
jgi:MATE family multidrug resistance protein